MYRTFSSIILNRFESLNLRLLSQIANIRPKQRPVAVPSIPASGRAGNLAVGGEDGDDPMSGSGVLEGKVKEKATPTPGGGGGGKKKKKGKR